MRYQCPCGYIYDEEVEGKKFEELDDSWVCPNCGIPKDQFFQID